MLGFILVQELYVGCGLHVPHRRLHFWGVKFFFFLPWIWVVYFAGMWVWDWSICRSCLSLGVCMPFWDSILQWVANSLLYCYLFEKWKTSCWVGGDVGRESYGLQQQVLQQERSLIWKINGSMHYAYTERRSERGEVLSNHCHWWMDGRLHENGNQSVLIKRKVLN